LIPVRPAHKKAPAILWEPFLFHILYACERVRAGKSMPGVFEVSRNVPTT
jgi:hypothetical protein